jgi:hypothetical protein
LLRAADLARSTGIQEITAIEFGVATGAGLLNLERIARKVTKTTGVRINIVGFDSGQGLPAPVDFRDHPNLYRRGDFPMDFERLKASLPENVSLEIGDLATTLPRWIERQSPKSPIGYVVVDLDYYSSTATALRLFSNAPELYLPFVVTYFDDIVFDEHNAACGELLAIHEFNASHRNRIIEQPVFLPARRVYKHAPWLKQTFFCHVLDHPLRTHSPELTPQILENPFL